jgi:hypothetical protein
MMRDAKQDIRSNFGKIWPAHVMNLTRFLIECRRTFDGDLELFLVLAVIGDRTFSLRMADPAMDYETWQSGKGPYTKPEQINATSIALYSGIPRETVRRKVQELMQKGWVERDAKGHLTATKVAANELQPLTQTSMNYLGGMFELFETYRSKQPG